MAVTKRTRFEVLRRDNHTCQYCGAKAPDVVLHIDHVMPVSLGGDDKPNNLLTACAACNGGKTSIAPGSPLVDSLGDRAAAYALGMMDKMTRLRASLDSSEAYCEAFEMHWKDWKRAGESLPLPADWEMTLYRWSSMGVPMRLIEMAMAKAMTKRGLYGEHPQFSYMAGIVARKLDESEIDFTVTEETAAVYTEWEKDALVVEAYEIGLNSGKRQGQEIAVEYFQSADIIAAHIDGRRTPHMVMAGRRK